MLFRSRQGDMIAFYNIYERYCKRLFGFVLRYIKNETDAEDIVQEVFIKVWETRNKIDVYSSFEAFLFTIAYNSTISLFRKRVCEKKYLDYLRLLLHLEKAPDLTDEIQFNDLNRKVRILLNELTERQKEIFLLSREEGLSHEEIAKKLNITINTVKKHMVNSLAFLKAGLDSSLMINMLFVYFFI